MSKPIRIHKKDVAEIKNKLISHRDLLDQLNQNVFGDTAYSNICGDHVEENNLSIFSNVFNSFRNFVSTVII